MLLFEIIFLFISYYLQRINHSCSNSTRARSEMVGNVRELGEMDEQEIQEGIFASSLCNFLPLDQEVNTPTNVIMYNCCDR